MAKVTIENAKVDRVFSTQHGYGAAVFESFEKRDGTTGRSRYTLWFKEDPNIEAGQVVSASGFLGVKPSEYTDRDGNARTGVDVSVRSARIIAAERPVPPAPEDLAEQEPWGTEPF